jgi:hypothetical protein
MTHACVGVVVNTKSVAVNSTNKGANMSEEEKRQCPFCGEECVVSGVYRCPACDREGCDYCIPLGKDGPCPECEDEEGA